MDREAEKKAHNEVTALYHILFIRKHVRAVIGADDYWWMEKLSNGLGVFVSSVQWLAAQMSNVVGINQAEYLEPIIQRHAWKLQKVRCKRL